MINVDDVLKESIIEHNSNCPYISDNPNKKLIISESRFLKTNALLNLRKHQPNIHKIFWYANGQYEVK